MDLHSSSTNSPDTLKPLKNMTTGVLTVAARISQCASRCFPGPSQPGHENRSQHGPLEAHQERDGLLQRFRRRLHPLGQRSCGVRVEGPGGGSKTFIAQYRAGGSHAARSRAPLRRLFRLAAEQPLDTFNTDLAVNVGGAQVAAQAVAAKLSERGSGTILLTGGGFALQPSADNLSLCNGKAGIRALAQGLFESFKEKGIHVATVTVAAFVSPGSNDAEAVAGHFWQLHSQPKGAWTVEALYPS